jgi:hypothetical protein
VAAFCRGASCSIKSRDPIAQHFGRLHFGIALLVSQSIAEIR